MRSRTPGVLQHQPGLRVVAAGMGSAPDDIHPHPDYRDDSRRQHLGHTQRLHTSPPPDSAELFHRVAGSRRSDCRDPGDAHQCGLLDNWAVAFRHPHLQDVADFRRDVLHRLDTESVRDRAGPILGNNGPHQLRTEEDPQASVTADRRGVAIIVNYQLAAPNRMERLAGNGRLPKRALPAYATTG